MVEVCLVYLLPRYSREVEGYSSVKWCVGRVGGEDRSVLRIGKVCQVGLVYMYNTCM